MKNPNLVNNRNFGQSKKKLTKNQNFRENRNVNFIIYKEKTGAN